MPAPSARAVIAAAALAAFALVYVVPPALGLPQLWYLPLAHAWAWGTKPQGIAISLFGRMLAALVAGGVAALIAALVVRRRAAPSPRAALVAIWLAAGAIGLAAAWCVAEARHLGDERPIGQVSP